MSIDVHNNVFTVSGQSNTSSERNDDGYLVRERRYGKFTRTLSLPQGIKVRFLWCVVKRLVYTVMLMITVRHGRFDILIL